MAARVRSESAQRVSGCVTALLKEQPFFGSLALRLPVRADAGRETLASDGREIRYSPQWIAETDAHIIETAIARVVLACALKHHTRRGERDPERWQRASQLVTHGLLRDAGFTLPPDAETWDGISVEEAYDRLPEPDKEESGDGSPPDSGGGPGADAAGTPMSDGTDPSDEDDGGQQSGDGDGGEACGSTEASNDDGGAGNNSGGAPASCDPSGTGEVMERQVSPGESVEERIDSPPRGFPRSIDGYRQGPPGIAIWTIPIRFPPVSVPESASLHTCRCSRAFVPISGRHRGSGPSDSGSEGPGA